jgi:hypothetical protein
VFTANNKVESKIMNNYFSLGVDAKIALEFHTFRNEMPNLCASRFGNKVFPLCQYGQIISSYYLLLGPAVKCSLTLA